MANWLERAHAAFQKNPYRSTAKTDETRLSAVLAVPHQDVTWKLSRTADGFGSNDSTPVAHFPTQATRVESGLQTAIAANDLDVDAATEARRQRVLAILEANPGFRYAIITSDDEPNTVVVHVAIRGLGSGEIVIAKARYDGFELIRALEAANNERN